MVIALESQGTTPTAAAAGTGSTTLDALAAPAGVAVGDVVILFVATKPDTATISTPTNWTLLGSVAGGGGTTGTDAGPMRLAAFSRTRDANWDGTTMPTVTITNGTSSWGQAFRFSKSLQLWSLAAASGADSTTGAAWSVTCSTNPGLTAGDYVIVGSAIPTDVSTPGQFSAEAVSATGVSAWGTVTERSEPETTVGGDAGGFVFTTSVTTGTATAAPVITATAGGTTTNVRGVSLLVRLREVASNDVAPATVSGSASIPTPAVSDGNILNYIVNQASGISPRNGTTSHTFTFGFTPTNGNLLAILVGGAVTHTNASWTERVAPVSSGELSLFTKVSDGTETTFVDTVNGSNYPIAWCVYEFASGSTYTNSIGENSTDDVFPALTGLPGTPQFVIAGFSNNWDSPSGSSSGTWDSGWVEDADLGIAASGTSGTVLFAAHQQGVTASSITPSGTFVRGGSPSADRQLIVGAIAAVPVTSGDATVTPVTLSRTVAIPAPTASVSSSVTVSAATVASSIAITPPTVSGGTNVSVGATTTSCTSSIPSPTVQAGANATIIASTVPSAATIGSPTVSASSGPAGYVVNQTSGTSPRNGTTTHTISLGFTPTSGNFLVFIASGAITHTSATWTERLQPVSSGELSVFTKTSDGTETTFIDTTNGSNYPVAWVAYEFEAGSTYTAGTSDGTSTSNTFPTLSGLPGTQQFVLAAYARNHDGGTGTASVAWGSSFVKDADIDIPDDGTTDGTLLSVARLEEVTTTSVTPTATPTLPPSNTYAPDIQKVVFAIDAVAVGGVDATVAPSAVSGVVAISLPTIIAPIAVPASTVSVATTIAVPSVAMGDGAVINATTVSRIANIGLPTLQYGAGVIAATVARTVSIATPTVSSAAKRTIAQENALTGTSTGWSISGSGSTSNVGFARTISVEVGNTIEFSCSGAGTFIDIYRIGYYAGNGWRLVDTISNTATTQPAGTVIPNSNGSVTCTAWSVTASWNVPANHTSGLHVAVYRNGTDRSWIPFIVRDNSRQADIIVKTSDATWGLAYNGYGGHSLYGSYNVNGTNWAAGAWDTDQGRGHAMSYHRPIPTRSIHPTTYWMNAEYPLIRYFERSGFNVKYVSSKDVNDDPSCLDGASVIISSGHDEYWSQEMRDAFTNARDSGQHLIFLSGNEVFWRTRFVGNEMWCYKDTMPGPGSHVAGVPLDPVTWTGTWRDTRRPAPGSEPESLLTGTFFRMNGIVNNQVNLSSATYGDHVAWRNSTMATGTNLVMNGVVGFEADEMDPDQPLNSLSTIAAQTYNIDGSRADDNGQNYSGSGNMAWGIITQRYDSGAVVVGFGTIQWAWGLDNGHDNGGAVASLAAQQMIANLLVDLGAVPETPISGVTISAPESLDNYGLMSSTIATTGAASLSLSGTSTARSPAAGSASLSLTASSVPKAAATGAGLLSLTASGGTNAGLMSTALLTFTASGAASATQVSGSASITLISIGVGATSTIGAAQLVLSGSATARAPTAGASSLILSALGALRATVAGSGSLTLSSAGTSVASGAGQGSLILSGSGTAAFGTSGSGSLTLSGAGTGHSVIASSGSLTLSAAGTAATQSIAVGNGSLTLTASGLAQIPGGGLASLSLFGSSAASVESIGSSSLILTASGTAAAQSGTSGSGSLLLSGSGVSQVSEAGSASLSLTGSGSAGHATSGAGSISLSAQGTAFEIGSLQGQAQITLFSSSVVAASSVGSASLSLTGSGPIAARIAGTGSLSLLATATSRGALVGNASLALVGSVTTLAQTIATGSLALTAIGISHTESTGVASISLVGLASTQAAVTGFAEIALGTLAGVETIAVAEGTAALSLIADISLVDVQVQTAGAASLSIVGQGNLTGRVDITVFVGQTRASGISSGLTIAQTQTGSVAVGDNRKSMAIGATRLDRTE